MVASAGIGRTSRRGAGCLGQARPPARGPAATLAATSPGIPLADSGDEGEPMTLTEAYQVLGLDPKASHEAVHAAYRRLAKARHPDRFARLGPAAVATAAFAFERLREAYALTVSLPSEYRGEGK